MELLIRLPELATLDVRVERRIALVTIDHGPINLMDATLLGELDQLAGWLATQGDAVRVVIFQSGVSDFFLAHLDLRFAVRGRAVFNQFETGLGILPAGSGSQHLPRLLGRGRALEVILGHDDLDAETAERYGWVNRALDENGVDAFIDRLASRIASQPLWLLAAAKRAADALAPSLQRGLELEREASRAAFAGAHGRVSRAWRSDRVR
jgi:enoyl-CoA hydratase/carnithine racemase